MKSKLWKLAKMVLSFQMIESDKGTLIVDTELAVGVDVSVETAEGEVVPAADGQYIIGNQTVEIKDGKVESIEVIEEEPEPQEPQEEVLEEPSQEEQPDEKDLRIEELEGLLKDRDAVIEELTAKIKELEDELNKPVEEPVKMSATVKQINNVSGALKYFNK